MKKLLSTLTISLLLVFSLNSFVFAVDKDIEIIQKDMQKKVDAKNGKPLDKTHFYEIFKSMDAEIGYTEFYNNTTPDDPDIEEKFKNLAKRVDQYNKKHGYENTFDLEQIINSENLFEISVDMGGGNGDGVNQLYVETYDTGDICLIDNPGGHLQGEIQHAGMMDKRLFYNYDSLCFLTAQPNLGVIYESPNTYRNNYDDAYSCMVFDVTDSQRVSAVALADNYIGQSYYWYASKTDTTKWYCSKVPWYGYNNAVSVDIDADGGYWVIPSDILYDSNIYCWSHWE